MFVLQSTYNKLKRQFNASQMELCIKNTIVRDLSWQNSTNKRLIGVMKRKIDELREQIKTKGTTNMNKKLLDLIKQKFNERLQAKTGWGRNDVMNEYQAAVNDALIELMDQQQTQTKEQ